MAFANLLSVVKLERLKSKGKKKINIEYFFKGGKIST